MKLDHQNYKMFVSGLWMYEKTRIEAKVEFIIVLDGRILKMISNSVLR